MISDLLISGYAVARFDGKMEWGARSLGNRSILANPSKSDIVKNVTWPTSGTDNNLACGPYVILMQPK